MCMCVCVVVLISGEGRLLATKSINFDTSAGCVYCPAGQCDCDVSLDIIRVIGSQYDVASSHKLNARI